MADYYSYPSDDFQRWRNLLATLGSYWSELYEDRSHLRSLTEARILAHEQTMFELMRLFDALSRYKLPILRRENWYVVYLKESDKNADPARYGGSHTYGDGLKYGGASGRTGYTFPIPADITEASVVVNRFTEPSLLWSRDVDYELDAENHTIRFREDPFSLSTVAIRETRDGTGLEDREAVLWLYRPQCDFEDLYYQFGYVLGQKLASTETSRTLTNAILDAITGGTARRDILRCFAAVTGIPVVVEPTETVEYAGYDHQHLLVATDQHVYRFSPNCTAIVDVGDTVHAGDQLVDCLRYYDFNRGATPSSLQALAIGEGYLSSCFYADLIFENSDVPLTVEESVDGFTKVSFGLGGFPLDVEEFFDQTHERGIALSTLVTDPECRTASDLVEYPQAYPDGTPCGTEPTQPDSVWREKGTLAHHLDTRPRVVGEPTANTLPGTINPLEFLIENVLRNHVFAVRIQTKGLGTQAVGLREMGYIQRLVPPGTAMLVIVELTPQQEVVTMGMLDDTELGFFDGVTPFEEELGPDDFDDGRLHLKPVSGTCL